MGNSLGGGWGVVPNVQMDFEDTRRTVVVLTHTPDYHSFPASRLLNFLQEVDNNEARVVE